MKLNHLNLTVTDPIATSEFLAKYFELCPGGGNGGMQMLNDDNGLVLTLINEIERPRAVQTRRRIDLEAVLAEPRVEGVDLRLAGQDEADVWRRAASWSK